MRRLHWDLGSGDLDWDAAKSEKVFSYVSELGSGDQNHLLTKGLSILLCRGDLAAPKHQIIDIKRAIDQN